MVKNKFIISIFLILINSLQPHTHSNSGYLSQSSSLPNIKNLSLSHKISNLLLHFSIFIYNHCKLGETTNSLSMLYMLDNPTVLHYNN